MDNIFGDIMKQKSWNILKQKGWNMLKQMTGLQMTWRILYDA